MLRERGERRHASTGCCASCATQPTTSAFISRRAPADRQGGTLGTNQSFASLARTFGPALGGWLYGNVGARAPYAAASLGMVLAFLLAMRLSKPAGGALT